MPAPTERWDWKQGPSIAARALVSFPSPPLSPHHVMLLDPLEGSDPLFEQVIGAPEPPFNASLPNTLFPKLNRGDCPPSFSFLFRYFGSLYDSLEGPGHKENDYQSSKVAHPWHRPGVPNHQSAEPTVFRKARAHAGACTLPPPLCAVFSLPSAHHHNHDGNSRGKGVCGGIRTHLKREACSLTVLRRLKKTSEK